jgi:armadillo repeat-containing protein 8
LGSLLCARAHEELLYAIFRFQPSEPAAVKHAFARALRALAVATAELVGPSQWGLRDDSSSVREEAKVALEYFFQVWSTPSHAAANHLRGAIQLEILNVYIPLLVDPLPQVSMSIAQLLGSALRKSIHRSAVAEWMPPAERGNETKPRRGWEKPDVTNVNAPGRQGGWVARSLTSLLRSRSVKASSIYSSALEY